MHHELLLEIGVEEIPAGFIMPALDNITRGMRASLDELGLDYGEVRTAATPRRFAICVRDLASRQPDRLEEFFGPAKQAAFDDKNNPTKAAIGFAASKGCSVETLEVVTTAKGEYVRLVKEKQGEETAELLKNLLPQVITGLSFPKSMRWGSDKTVFARPIQWLTAIYGGSVVPFKIDEVECGNTTRGHRFMAPGPFEVTDFSQYLTILRDNHVLADCSERRTTVIESINRAVSGGVGNGEGEILPDEELVDIVTHLVEYPHGVCGVFDDRFLALPDSVLITAMREHQKYFSVTDKSGALLPRFVAVNNTYIADEKAAAAGHQRVLRARLEDALFFFNDDQKRTLADRVNDLSGLIFQNKLGTMLEKTERVVKLGSKMAEALAPEYTQEVERAALLAKADLMTAMVNEFPSLQGVMGRDYALLDNEKPAVAQALYEHYLPVRAGDKLPTEIIGALVGLADRLDTIAGCFGIGQLPSGTADPFGLRRLVLGFLHIVQDRSLTFSLSSFIDEALALYEGKLSEDMTAAKTNILEFMKGRFANDLITKGIPREAIEAVTSTSFDDLVDCRARTDALVGIKDQPTFAILAASFKRVMNILKGHETGVIKTELLQAEAEKQLFDILQAVRDEAAPYLANKSYDTALGIILKMKEPVDSFFDEVMVMVEDLQVRENRLNLLGMIAQLFLQVGDFSKMHVA
jgi:glycyl-tRNA synthetase beta chain